MGPEVRRIILVVCIRIGDFWTGGIWLLLIFSILTIISLLLLLASKVSFTTSHRSRHLLLPLLSLLNATHWWQLFRFSAIGNRFGFRVGNHRSTTSCWHTWNSRSAGHLSLFHFLSTVCALTDAWSGSSSRLRSHVRTDWRWLIWSRGVLPCVYLRCIRSHTIAYWRSPRLLFVLGSGRSLNATVSNILKLTEIV